MMFLWACAGVPLGIYNILKFNIALQVQAQILTALSLITLAQCVYYERVSFIRAVANVEIFAWEVCRLDFSNGSVYGGR